MFGLQYLNPSNVIEIKTLRSYNNWIRKVRKMASRTKITAKYIEDSSKRSVKQTLQPFSQVLDFFPWNYSPLFSFLTQKAHPVQKKERTHKEGAWTRCHVWHEDLRLLHRLWQHLLHLLQRPETSLRPKSYLKRAWEAHQHHPLRSKWCMIIDIIPKIFHSIHFQR